MSFARAFSALTGASAVSMAAQIVRGKLAALILGPAGVGIFNQLSLAWNVANVGGSLGTFNGIIQHGAEAIASGEKDAMRRLSSTFTLLLGAVSLGIAILGAVFARPLSGWLLHDGGAHGHLVALLMLGVPIGVTAQTYRALLSAGRAVSQLVRAQIFADLCGAAIFAGLVVWLGLEGAILGFMASHMLLFFIQAVYVRRHFGPGSLAPKPSQFSWKLVRTNLGFGASGLFLIVLSNLGVMLVSRLIIDRLGPEANGYFANGWRLASVYLGAVTATTIGYFLPTLARTETDADMAKEVNATLRFFLGILPPVMAGIMAGGGLLVWLILSQAFLPVAALLLIFVPAELMRILAETILTQFLARRRLRLYAAIYLGQFICFVGVATMLVPVLGVEGAAFAYFASMVMILLGAMIATRGLFGFTPELATLRWAALSVLLLGGVAMACLQMPEGLVRYAVCIGIVGAWLLLALRDSEFKRVAEGLQAKVSALVGR
jgi:O-antigen/teichoic acid export membrane protein